MKHHNPGEIRMKWWEWLLSLPPERFGWTPEEKAKWEASHGPDFREQNRQFRAGDARSNYGVLGRSRK